MMLTKTPFLTLGFVALTACMDSGGSAPVATRAAVPAANCAYHTGLSAQHLGMIGATRCGPQAALPYTIVQ